MSGAPAGFERGPSASSLCGGRRGLFPAGLSQHAANRAWYAIFGRPSRRTRQVPVASARERHETSRAPPAFNTLTRERTPPPRSAGGGGVVATLGRLLLHLKAASWRDCACSKCMVGIFRVQACKLSSSPASYIPRPSVRAPRAARVLPSAPRAMQHVQVPRPSCAAPHVSVRPPAYLARTRAVHTRPPPLVGVHWCTRAGV